LEDLLIAFGDLVEKNPNSIDALFESLEPILEPILAPIIPINKVELYLSELIY
jgi:hypothetical protein